MYDGSRYYGWQFLGNEDKQPTLQGTIEKTISILLEEPIHLIGAGRTDKGVHAYAQVANFYTLSKENLDRLQEKVNMMLPEDICIWKINEMKHSFHSRYDARKKTYQYYIDTREKPSVFYRKYRTFISEHLNIELMKKAALYLIGEHDFRGFSSIKNEKDTIREIYSIDIQKKDTIIIISITGNGFLYHMVRIIVGTLVDIGTGKRDEKEIKKILLSKERQLAGATIDSQGLFLKEVFY